MNINKDDPKLIDFVFDELAPHERQAVETAIEQDDEVRAAVAEIRAAVQASAETFEQEPALVLTEEQRQLLKLLSERTKVPVAAYIREGIEMILKKYRKDLPGQQLTLVEEDE